MLGSQLESFPICKFSNSHFLFPWKVVGLCFCFVSCVPFFNRCTNPAPSTLYKTPRRTMIQTALSLALVPRYPGPFGGLMRRTRLPFTSAVPGCSVFHSFDGNDISPTYMGEVSILLIEATYCFKAMNDPCCCIGGWVILFPYICFMKIGWIR